MKKIGIFFKSFGNKGHSFLNRIVSIFKTFLVILNLVIGLLWPYICLLGVLFIPVKKGSELLAAFLYAIVYISALYGYFRVWYLEKEIKYCRSCCMHVNPMKEFTKFFEKMILVEDEMSVLDAQAEILQTEIGVWKQALDLVPQENHELRKIYQDKIDECKESIKKLYEE